MRMELKVFLSVFFGAIAVAVAAIALALSGWWGGEGRSMDDLRPGGETSGPAQYADAADVPDLKSLCGYTDEQELALVEGGHVYESENMRSDLESYGANLQNAGYSLSAQETRTTLDAAGNPVETGTYAKGGRTVYTAGLFSMNDIGRILVKIDSPITEEELEVCRNDTIVKGVIVHILGDEPFDAASYVTVALDKMTTKLRFPDSTTFTDGIRTILNGDGSVIVRGELTVGNIGSDNEAADYSATFPDGTLENVELSAGKK